MIPTVLSPPHALDGLWNLVLLAQPAAAPGAGHGGGSHASGAGGLFAQPLFMVAMVAFVYFFMLRPMNKQKKDQEDLNRSLVKGDRVVTSSGIIGTITGLADGEVTVEVAEKVRVKFLRESITRKYDPAAATPAASVADKKS